MYLGVVALVHEDALASGDVPFPDVTVGGSGEDEAVEDGNARDIRRVAPNIKVKAQAIVTTGY